MKVDAPEKFAGSHDGDSVREFVRQCEMFFQLAGITDSSWMAYYASSRLSEHAAIWLESYPHLLGGQSGKPWLEFKQDLLDQFTPRDYSFYAQN